jgi:xanthine dehydrogenase accessory factor
MTAYVLIWGGGAIATGVAMRLHRVGIRVLVVETPQPMTVRRTVAFAQAVYDGEIVIEGVSGQLIESPEDMQDFWAQGRVPVWVDPELSLVSDYPPLVIVDARMRKIHEAFPLEAAELVIGLGPGFVVGENCHAAVETLRGHFLGRVYWEGSPMADTGIPGKVGRYTRERVFHAPTSGRVETFVEIGAILAKGDLVMKVGEHEIRAPFPGVVRGLIHSGLVVDQGDKIGDIDPRPETFRCWMISEKALAIGGGVLEAILTREDIRRRLWDD